MARIFSGFLRFRVSLNSRIRPLTALSQVSRILLRPRAPFWSTLRHRTDWEESHQCEAPDLLDSDGNDTSTDASRQLASF